MKVRSHSPGLYEALAASIETTKPGNQAATKGGKEQTLNMEVIPHDVKDSAMESIISACSDLGFTCKPPQK